MSETKLLFTYFLMGLILGGVGGALYIVNLVKQRKIHLENARYLFDKLLILLIIIGFVVLLASTVLK